MGQPVTCFLCWVGLWKILCIEVIPDNYLSSLILILIIWAGFLSWLEDTQELHGENIQLGYTFLAKNICYSRPICTSCGPPWYCLQKDRCRGCSFPFLSESEWILVMAKLINKSIVHFIMHCQQKQFLFLCSTALLDDGEMLGFLYSIKFLFIRHIL